MAWWYQSTSLEKTTKGQQNIFNFPKMPKKDPSGICRNRWFQAPETCPGFHGGYVCVEATGVSTKFAPGAHKPMMKDVHAGKWELISDHPHFSILPQKIDKTKLVLVPKRVEIIHFVKENDPSQTSARAVSVSTKPVSSLNFGGLQTTLHGIFLVQLHSIPKKFMRSLAWTSKKNDPKLHGNRPI